MNRGAVDLRFPAAAGPVWFLDPGLSPRLLVFDLDGTLAALASTPERARVPAGTARALARLAACPRTVVAVLSGRALAALVRKVGVPGLVYLGNHGLTSTRRGLEAPRRELERWTTRAARAGLRLAPIARQYPGCLVEVKGPDLSLHYRRVSPGRVPGLLRAARRALRGSGLTAREGKRVLEFRPPHGGDKGTAFLRLAARLAPGWRRSGLCLYVGDDRTDEDAFRTARRLGPRAVTIKIGSGTTRAEFRIGRQAGVAKLLAGLVCRPVQGTLKRRG